MRRAVLCVRTARRPTQRHEQRGVLQGTWLSQDLAPKTDGESRPAQSDASRGAATPIVCMPLLRLTTANPNHLREKIIGVVKFHLDHCAMAVALDSQVTRLNGVPSDSDDSQEAGGGGEEELKLNSMVVVRRSSSSIAATTATYRSSLRRRYSLFTCAGNRDKARCRISARGWPNQGHRGR
jgi:hypothetical protein